MPNLVTLQSKEMPPKNLNLLTYLKVMYVLGYLPISWENSKDCYNNGNFFKNSTIKSCIMLIFDFALALNCVTFYYMWHFLNMDKEFDLSSIWTLNYYVGIYDGVVTTALSQLCFCMFPTMVFWIYTFMG